MAGRRTLAPQALPLLFLRVHDACFDLDMDDLPRAAGAEAWVGTHASGNSYNARHRFYQTQVTGVRWATSSNSMAGESTQRPSCLTDRYELVTHTGSLFS
jgi:hypothetical protein